jgi:hypothetical protein
MNIRTISGAPFVLLAAVLLGSSCSYRHDTVSFGAVGKMSVVGTRVPQIEIDTNISVGTLVGGTVKSRRPYSIRAFYLDDSFTFASIEFTTVRVTYADGTVDPGSAGIKLPMRFGGKLHESHNSMDGGTVVVTKSRMIAAEFPGAIARDEPFTLLLKGHFIKENGSIIPFTVNGKYGVSRDSRTESWVDFVSGC